MASSKGGEGVASEAEALGENDALETNEARVLRRRGRDQICTMLIGQAK